MSYEDRILSIETDAEHGLICPGTAGYIAHEADAELATLKQRLAAAEAGNAALRAALEKINENWDQANSEHDDGAAFMMIGHLVVNALASPNPGEAVMKVVEAARELVRWEANCSKVGRERAQQEAKLSGDEKMDKIIDELRSDDPWGLRDEETGHDAHWKRKEALRAALAALPPHWKEQP